MPARACILEVTQAWEPHWPVFQHMDTATLPGSEPSPQPGVRVRVTATRVPLCVPSQQLGHLFKDSFVFLWSEANPLAAILGRALGY